MPLAAQQSHISIAHLALVTLTPSSKDIASAKHSAVYSPRLRPIAHVASSSAESPLSCRSFSKAAIEHTKIAGWLTSCTRAVTGIYAHGASPYYETNVHFRGHDAAFSAASISHTVALGLVTVSSSNEQGRSN